MKEQTKAAYKRAFLDSLPVLSGYVVLGIGFGILVKSKGFGVLWAGAMSIFIFAGSMQYLAAELMAEGAGLIAAALATLMVNARHLFYGISMVERYKNTGKAKPYLIFALTDETYSLVCRDLDMSEAEAKHYYLAVSLLDQLYWVCGSIIGSLLGSVLPFSTEGIDFALTALFVSIFVEQWLSQKDHRPALVGLFCSLFCLLLFGDGFLIPAMLLITLALTLLRGRGEAGA